MNFSNCRGRASVPGEMAGETGGVDIGVTGGVRVFGNNAADSRDLTKGAVKLTAVDASGEKDLYFVRLGSPLIRGRKSQTPYL